MSESQNNLGLAQPGKLPAMTYDEVKARAQSILDYRGVPPYKAEHFNVAGLRFDQIVLCDDEIAVINDFMIYWMPFLKVKEKR
jgi:hypothetical protein